MFFDEHASDHYHRPSTYREGDWWLKNSFSTNPRYDAVLLFRAVYYRSAGFNRHRRWRRLEALSRRANNRRKWLAVRFGHLLRVKRKGTYWQVSVAQQDCTRIRVRVVLALSISGGSTCRAIDHLWAFLLLQLAWRESHGFVLFGAAALAYCIWFTRRYPRA
jgi:hypothetical protein